MDLENKNINWEVSEVKCDLCNYKWVAVRPENTIKLECSNCNNVTSFTNIKTNKK